LTKTINANKIRIIKSKGVEKEEYMYPDRQRVNPASRSAERFSEKEHGR